MRCSPPFQAGTKRHTSAPAFYVLICRTWGNITYSYMDRYVQGNKFDKTCISMEVTKAVHQYKGRFLQRSSKGWKIIDDAGAREKAASAFQTRSGANASGPKPQRFVG
jgi:hypothetical protein